MATRVTYVCDTCGYSYTSVNEIFWLDENGKLVIKPLVINTSTESYNAPLKGFFVKYYCYKCGKFISKFIINKKALDMNDEYVFNLIDGYDDSLKIVQYDDAFQRCLKCGRELAARAEYSFSYDTNNEFHINKDFLGFSDGDSHKFSGLYYGYFCSKCKKQINKFVITENSANLDDSEIKAILEEHTNDLTIFIRRDYDICPECGEEVYYLNQNSNCPHCRRDELRISDYIELD